MVSVRSCGWSSWCRPLVWCRGTERASGPAPEDRGPRTALVDGPARRRTRQSRGQRPRSGLFEGAGENDAGARLRTRGRTRADRRQNAPSPATERGGELPHDRTSPGYSAGRAGGGLPFASAMCLGRDTEVGHAPLDGIECLARPGRDGGRPCRRSRVARVDSDQGGC